MELEEAQDLSKIRTAGLQVTERVFVYWTKGKEPYVVIDRAILRMARVVAATGLDLPKLALSKRWIPTRAFWDGTNPLKALAWCADDSTEGAEEGEAPEGGGEAP